MNSKHYRLLSVLLPALPVLAFSAISCKVDERYTVENVEDTDLSITVFGDGIKVPLGKTKQIRVDSLLALAGEDFEKFLAIGGDGGYRITLEDTFSLTEELEDMNISDLASIDGITFEENLVYSIGDFNTEDFTIEGSNYTTNISFDDVSSLNDIRVQEINESRSLASGIADYAGGDALDIDVDTFNKTFVLLEKSIVSDYVAPFGSSTVDIPIGTILPASVEVTGSTPILKLSEVELDENISSISNISFSDASRLNISISLEDCFLTSGTVTPNVSVDLSDVIKIKGVSGALVLNKPLNASNGWSASYSFTPEKLAQSSFSGNKFTISKEIPVTGELSITDPVTTGQKFASTGDTKVVITMSFDNFRIASATVALAKPFKCESQTVEIPIDFGPVEVPEQVSLVTILMDESKPIKLSLASDGLSDLNGLNIYPDITVSFPEGAVVDGADASNKLNITGNLADGDMNRDLLFKSFTIAPKNGIIEYHDMVVVSASASADGSFDIAKVNSDDMELVASIIGQPDVADYRIYVDPVVQPMEFNEDCSFDIDGIGSFGTFSVYPEGTDNKIVMNLNIPEISGVDITAPGDGLKAVFPPYVVFGSLDPALNYNAAENSINIKGTLPEQVILPVEKLQVTPVATGDTYHIAGAITVTGDIVASPASPEGYITKAALNDIAGKEIGMEAIVPTIKAKRLELEDDFCFDFEEDLEEMTFLSAEDIPEQLVSISSLELKDVYADIDVRVSDLPDMGSSKFHMHLEVTLPEMVDPSVIVIDRDLASNADGSVSTDISEKINGLRDIVFDGEDICGKIHVKGSLTAVQPSIEDLSSLKSDIKCDINGSLGNNDGKIEIEQATGRFKYDISTDTSVDLAELPEQLKGEDINLDIKPVITMNVRTNLGIPINGSIVITPFIGGNPIDANKVVIKDVELPYSTDGKEASKEFVFDDEIYPILRRIPESIKIEVTGGVDGEKDCTLDPQTAYTCDLDYKIDVPFEFGEDFKVKFTQDVDLPDDLETVTSSVKAIGLIGTVTNSTPLDVNLDVVFLDKDGSPVLIDGTKSLVIKACDASGAAVDTPLDFSLNLKDTDCSTLDKVRLVFNLTAQPDIVLKNDNFLQLGLSLVLPEGISYDFNSDQE